MLAERAMHARARHRVERGVGDVAGERMAEVEDVAFAVAEPARAEPHDRVLARAEGAPHHVAARRIGRGAPMLGGARIQLREVGEAERTAGDREPVDDDVLGAGQLLDAVGEELLERRRQAHRVEIGAVRAHERVVADLEHAALEQRVDHLEQVERIAADARHELGADLPDAVADGQARLDEADLLLARQRMELDADLALEERRHAIVGPRDEHEQHRQRVGRLQELGDEIERRFVGPLEALDDEHERLIERDRGDEMTDAADEHLLAVVRVLVLARGLRPVTGLLVRRDLGETRDHRVRHVGLRGAASRARDEVGDLVVRLVTARADRVANEIGERAVRAPPCAPACTLHVPVARSAAARRGRSRGAPSCRSRAHRRWRGTTRCPPPTPFTAAW